MKKEYRHNRDRAGAVGHVFVGLFYVGFMFAHLAFLRDSVVLEDGV